MTVLRGVDVQRSTPGKAEKFINKFRCERYLPKVFVRSHARPSTALLGVVEGLACERCSLVRRMKATSVRTLVVETKAVMMTPFVGLCGIELRRAALRTYVDHRQEL